MSVLYHISYFSLYHLPLYTATILSIFGYFFSNEKKKEDAQKAPSRRRTETAIMKKDLLFETLIL